MSPRRRPWFLRAEERLEPGKQRIFAAEYVIERSYRHRLRAMASQEAAERIKLGRRAVQRHHSGRRRSAERQLDAEALPGLGKQGVVASGEAGADLTVFV